MVKFWIQAWTPIDFENVDRTAYIVCTNREEMNKKNPTLLNSSLPSNKNHPNKKQEAFRTSFETRKKIIIAF